MLIKTNNKAIYWFKKSVQEGINFRLIDENLFTITIDETTSLEDIDKLLAGKKTDWDEISKLEK